MTSASRPRRWLLLPMLALVLVLLAICSSTRPPGTAAPEVSLWDTSITPKTPAHAEGRSVELGLRLTALVRGRITGLRVYRGESSDQTLPAWLRSSDGLELGGANLAPAAAAGWQSVRLNRPVAVDAGETVIAAYRALDGRYPADVGYFSSHPQTQNGVLRASSGVFRYADSETFTSWRGTNYWVDVVFEPFGNPGELGARAPAGSSSRPSIRPVDGGRGYYGRFAHGLPTSDDFFPVGVWFEEAATDEQVETDQAAGINLYVELTESSRLPVVAAHGMYALPSWGSGDRTTVGTLLMDEADMWGGPGEARWTGKYPGQGAVCAPAGSRCGYSAMRDTRSRAAHGSMTLANYGKGVLFWETDEQASRFVTEYQDVVSTDAYWFTDPSICIPSQGGAFLGLPEGHALDPSSCRAAANYGRVVDRVRRLVQPAGSKPVWAFVELGHPASEPEAPTITGPQVRAAVWSSIIHGARGVIYFNHSFGGNCLSQHVLRDLCGAAVRDAVAATNQQIASLAPVLNAPFVDGLATSTPGVDLAVKLSGQDLYVIAGSTSAARQVATITVPCSGSRSVAVIGEHRTVPVNDSRISDEFADGNAVHIYRFSDDRPCLSLLSVSSTESR